MKNKPKVKLKSLGGRTTMCMGRTDPIFHVFFCGSVSSCLNMDFILPMWHFPVRGLPDVGTWGLLLLLCQIQRWIFSRCWIQLWIFLKIFN